MACIIENSKLCRVSNSVPSLVQVVDSRYKGSAVQFPYSYVTLLQEIIFVAGTFLTILPALDEPVTVKLRRTPDKAV
jgi:hypothetical protein